eukprot:Rhum_TRINITY_DN14910_c2_g1::Rhum_TRINITY_DN14910_c2_g1_i1::g.127753::m.127753
MVSFLNKRRRRKTIASYILFILLFMPFAASKGFHVFVFSSSFFFVSLPALGRLQLSRPPRHFVRRPSHGLVVRKPPRRRRHARRRSALATAAADGRLGLLVAQPRLVAQLVNARPVLRQPLVRRRRLRQRLVPLRAQRVVLALQVRDAPLHRAQRPVRHPHAVKARAHLRRHRDARHHMLQRLHDAAHLRHLAPLHHVRQLPLHQRHTRSELLRHHALPRRRLVHVDGHAARAAARRASPQNEASVRRGRRRRRHQQVAAAAATAAPPRRTRPHDAQHIVVVLHRPLQDAAARRLDVLQHEDLRPHVPPRRRRRRLRQAAEVPTTVLRVRRVVGAEGVSSSSTAAA